MGKLRIHIENNRLLGDVFDLSPRRVKEALKRHPTAAKNVSITIGYDGDILEKRLRAADVLIGWKYDWRNLDQRAPRLRWIHSIGAGVEHMLPLTWLPKGVVLTNNRGVHGNRATEYVIGAVLMLNNRLPEMVTNQRARRWQQCFNTTIRGKTLLVVGVGHVGGDAAKWAKRFGMYVIGIRRSGKRKQYVDEMHRPAALRKLIPQADFVLVSAPDTRHSHQIIGREEIYALKTGAGLLNYSRAGLVDYDALKERLERNELSAVLDVFDPEPLPRSSSLWRTPNLIITPHSSSDDPAQYVPGTLGLVLCNAVRLTEGKRLFNVVDPKLEY